MNTPETENEHRGDCSIKHIPIDLASCTCHLNTPRIEEILSNIEKGIEAKFNLVVRALIQNINGTITEGERIDICNKLNQDGINEIRQALTQDHHSLHTSLVAAVVGLEYNENDIDGNHSYDRARQNEGFKYAQEEVLTIINSIFKE